jgi:gamma-glutamyltranspeptidase/glutathione hydrolase
MEDGWTSSAAWHTRPALGLAGAAATAHPLATGTAQVLLAAGGSAVDAAIAAQAVLCVVAPHSCGIGGDALLLVRTPDGTRDGHVTALNGTGCSPARPVPVGTDGGSSVTVPGLVDAWVTASQRWGALPLAACLAPAVRLARGGFEVEDDLLAAVAAQRGRLVRGGAGEWDLLNAARSTRWHQPELAATLERIGADGASAFYAGPVAEALVAAVARDGGVLAPDDLAAHRSAVADPVAVPWAGGTAYVQPPMSQGVLLAMALNALERDVEPPDDHVLVEVTEAAFGHRNRCGEGASLLGLELPVDRGRAARRGGPRAYLHTAGVAVADAAGCTVSSLVSVFDDFGAGTFVPEGGFVLNNRAAGFTAAPNDAAPSKRPVHTLAPALVVGADGAVTGLATPGADGQVQTLLQVLARMRWSGADLAEALASPRWRSEGGRLLVEAGHRAAERLEVLGHDVAGLPAGDDRFGAVVAAGITAGGSPYAAADWRRRTWSGAV